jgi:hypothetical protein
MMAVPTPRPDTLSAAPAPTCPQCLYCVLPRLPRLHPGGLKSQGHRAKVNHLTAFG